MLKWPIHNSYTYIVNLKRIEQIYRDRGFLLSFWRCFLLVELGWDSLTRIFHFPDHQGLLILVWCPNCDPVPNSFKSKNFDGFVYTLCYSAKLDPPKNKVEDFFGGFTQPQFQILHRTGFKKSYNLQPNLHTVCRASFRIASCKAFLSAWQDLNGSWYVTSTGLTKMIWIVEHGQRSKVGMFIQILSQILKKQWLSEVSFKRCISEGASRVSLKHLLGQFKHEKRRCSWVISESWT